MYARPITCSKRRRRDPSLICLANHPTQGSDHDCLCEIVSRPDDVTRG